MYNLFFSIKIVLINKIIMFEIIQYTFIQNALFVGIILSCVYPLLGAFLVTGRQTIFADMLSHTALVGVGLGFFFNISPHWTITGFSILISFLLVWLLRIAKIPSDALSMLFLSGGLALALLLARLNTDNYVSFESYLFGNILTVSNAEVILLLILSIIIIFLLLILWRPFLLLVTDKELMQTKYKYAVIYEWIFLALVAIIISLSLKIIGGLLISALLVIPSLITRNFVDSFAMACICGVLISFVCILLGIIISILYSQIPASSAIVLTLIGFFIVSMFYRKKII